MFLLQLEHYFKFIVEKDLIQMFSNKYLKYLLQLEYYFKFIVEKDLN